MSVFDPESFLNQDFTEKLDTTYPVLPEGTYRATISRVEARNIQFRDGNSAPALEVTFDVEAGDAAKEIGRERLSVRHTIFLNLDGKGRLDPKNNQALARLREAVGQLDISPWSPRMLQGAGPVYVLVTVGQSASGTDYNNIRKITPAE